MFFGGLFMAYMLYRVWYPEAWSEGSPELDIVLGGFNTVVLIGSSLTMALAVRVGADRQAAATINWLHRHDGARPDVPRGQGLRVQAQVRPCTTCPASNFHVEPNAGTPGQVQIFFSLYFALTGLHALHMVIGFGILAVITWMAAQEAVLARVVHAGRDGGLYWHFVDIVWIFLFPLLYLVDRADRSRQAPMSHISPKSHVLHASSAR